jgi:hypothetical protein
MLSKHLKPHTARVAASAGKPRALRLGALRRAQVIYGGEHTDLPFAERNRRKTSSTAKRAMAGLMRRLNCIEQIAQRDRLFQIARAYRCGFRLSLLGTERCNENETFSRVKPILIL